jgi:tRNA nucleotidyltransferase (CCA-adding enzyme)
MNRTVSVWEQELLGKILGQKTREIIDALERAGATCYLVGGAVRDLLLGIPATDIDIEVHRVSLERLQELLAPFGRVDLVGKSFGVLRIAAAPDVDWSVPRRDGPGRKPAVVLDSDMGIVEALRRRDLTMNAMAICTATGELVDPFGGQADMRAKRLRAPDLERFVEDPLRFFRVMQFVGRFDMYPDSALQACCASMDLQAIARERIEEEFYKLFLKSRLPSRGIRWLKDVGRLGELFPELGELCGLEQPVKWHPEGDVFEHTMQALDASVSESIPDDYRLVFCYAALCHDLGKVETTERMPDGRIASHGHETAGVARAASLLRRITRNVQLISLVKLLVRHHMAPGQFVKTNAGRAAYKRLAMKVMPLSLKLLACCASADMRGRNGSGHEPLPGPVPVIEEFMARAEAYGVLEGPEEPVVQGKDFLTLCEPGPVIGDLVRAAYRLQIDEGICDRDVLVQRVMHGYVREKKV